MEKNNFSSCDELRNWLQNQKQTEIIESDMNPDDPRMGRCQFMVNIIPKDDVETIYDTLDDSNAEYKGPNPMGAYNIALPPEDSN